MDGLRIFVEEREKRMHVRTVGLAMAFCCGIAFCGEREGLDVGVQAPPLLGGKWIPDGKAPALNGTVRLVHFWFAG
jgi:hypothetical protein